MTVGDGGFSPLEQLWEVSTGLVRALEAAIHFVENADRLSAEEPASPWPDWYGDGYVGLLSAVAAWYKLFAPPDRPDEGGI